MLLFPEHTGRTQRGIVQVQQHRLFLFLRVLRRLFEQRLELRRP